MTEIAVFDQGLLNLQASQMQSKKQSSALEQDFGEVLSKAKDVTSENPKEVTKKTEDITKEIQNEISKEKPVVEKPEKQEALENSENPEKTENTDKKSLEAPKAEKKDDLVVDEETLAQIQETLAKIMMMLEEMIGVSPEEIEDALNTLDMNTTDLLNGNLSELILTLSGEESIGMVMNEDLLHFVRNLNQEVQTQWEQLEELTGLNQEQLQEIIKKLEETPEKEADNVVVDFEIPEEEPAKVENALENIPKEKENNILPFEEKREISNKTDSEMPKEEEAIIETKPLEPQKKETNEKETKQSFEQNGQEQQLEKAFDRENPEAVEKTESFTYSKMDTESILKQIADYVKVQKNQDLTEMEMQLHPASLGTIKINLATKGGSVTAQFTAQNESVKQALEASVAQLRTNLEEQGVKIDAIEISVASHQMERNLDQNGQSNQEQQNKEADERINKIRRKNINLRAWANGEENLDEIEDEDMKLTVEMMTMYGNSMDLLA